MVALNQEVPFRRDAILGFWKANCRDKGLSLELLAGLCELLGMTCQIAKTKPTFVNSTEASAIMLLEDVPVVFNGKVEG